MDALDRLQNFAKHEQQAAFLQMAFLLAAMP